MNRPKSFRLALPLIFLIALAAALPSCRGTKKDESVAEQDRVPAFFEEIPADTIFFVGSRDPVPKSVVESMVGGAETWRKISEELDSEALEMLDMEKVEQEDVDPLETFLKEELGDEITVENFEKLGFDSTPRFALYGLGTVPVFRLELDDGEKLRGVLQRYRKEFKPDWKRREVAGVGYWEYVVPDTSPTLGEAFGDDPSSMRVEMKGQAAGQGAVEPPDQEDDPGQFTLFRITDDEVIVTFLNADTREQALPYFLGIKKPTESLATSERIGELASRHGLEKWFVAFFDIGTAADILEDPTAEATTITERVLQAEDPWSDYSEVCRRDTARLMRPMTVFYGGLREYSDEVTDVVFGLELQEDAARRLAQVRSGTPGYSTKLGQNAIFMTGWGVRTGEMVGLVADVAKSFQTDPLECEEYKSLNNSSKSMASARMNMPAWASAIDGFSMMLHSIGFELKEGEGGEAAKPVIKPRALAVLDTTKPEALLFFVQTFVPELKEMNLRPDGVPVPIPGAQGAYEGLIEPVVFMTRDGIGASVGKNMKEPTVELLAKDEPVTSPIFVMRANLGEAARVTLDELDHVIDVAAENRQERGLSEEDIAQSKKLVADLQALFAERRMVAGFTVEIDEYGALMSYRAEGAAWDVDWEEQFSGFDERFEALERVLGTYEEPPGPPGDLGNTQGTINGSSTSPGPNPPRGQAGDKLQVGRGQEGSEEDSDEGATEDGTVILGEMKGDEVEEESDGEDSADEAESGKAKDE